MFKKGLRIVLRTTRLYGLVAGFRCLQALISDMIEVRKRGEHEFILREVHLIEEA